jgi:predicted transcriptional regulator
MNASTRVSAPDAGIDGSAVRYVTASTQGLLWTISEDCGLGEVVENMARLGVRGFLVTREQQIVGLITFEDIQRQRTSHRNAYRVADVMTDASHVPMIQWQTVVDATVSDLLQIFDSTHANHLVVVEPERRDFTRVRGLIHRRQLVGQLGVYPILDRGMQLALAALGRDGWMATLAQRVVARHCD